jgi:hypothetical protein
MKPTNKIDVASLGTLVMMLSDIPNYRMLWNNYVAEKGVGMKTLDAFIGTGQEYLGC